MYEEKAPEQPETLNITMAIENLVPGVKSLIFRLLDLLFRKIYYISEYIIISCSALFLC